nr:MAG TPA: hypothetical protein [Caudoviricetes sp.]
MSAFEILFETFYVSAAIIWSCYLIADIAADITKNGELDWGHIMSVVIMVNLALFIIAKFGLE